jgi:hypothetical protein
MVTKDQFDLFENEAMTEEEIGMKMLSLHHRQKHSAEDSAFIRKHLKRDNYCALYYTWTQVRTNGKYYGFAIFNERKSKRRAAVFKSIKIIAERPLSDKEWNTEVINYGCCSRILNMYDWEQWESVPIGDKQWGAETPKEVIEAYKKFNPQTIIDKKKCQKK